MTTAERILQGDPARPPERAPVVPSFVVGAWTEGEGDGTLVRDAVRGAPLARVSAGGIDLEGALRWARETGGPALRALPFHERARRLKALAKVLLERKDALYALSARSGATRRDAWIDVDGGVGTLFAYASLVRREFPDETFLLEGAPIPLAKDESFWGRHLLTSKEGVAFHIGAFNFPCWGMLEKLAPTLLAGVPAVLKPAPQTAYVTQAMVETILDSGLLPEGAVQLVCGDAVEPWDFLTEQDAVTFTGSAATGRKLKALPQIVECSIPFTLEADSLNAAILGSSVQPGDPEFDLFVREVAREMTIKAGQRCTAIRRALVPRDRAEAVRDALAARLAGVRLGDPTREEVRMGPLVDAAQRDEVAARIERLKESCEVAIEGALELDGGDAEAGGFLAPTLLWCDDPHGAREPHEVEAFGPVATLLPYDAPDDAVRIAALGRGSLVATVATRDADEARALVLGLAPHHGRLLILNRDDGESSTGHGSPLPLLVHGGPGRAGGGEELGGARAVKHYMQRTAVQGDPTLLTAVGAEFVPGARTVTDDVHPFRKTFDELAIGERFTSHRRTVTEADVVNFANVSGDYFYAHVDALAAADSIFEERVAHGYFLVSAAAGLFVHPAPGPVLANYGLERLRFVEPVRLGDTIRAHLTVKRKTRKERREDDRFATGVVEWDVRLTNQTGDPVALYNILTLVERAEDELDRRGPA